MILRRTLVKISAGGLLVLALAGCTTPYGEPNRTGTGALIGGLSGAGFGAMMSHHHPGGGAVLGGALGAIAGGLIGNSMDQQARGPVYAAGPAPRYVWIERQWVWNGQNWVWVEGHWEAVP